MAIKIVVDDPIGEAVELVVNICKDLFEKLDGGEAHHMLSKDFYALMPSAIEIWKETRHGF
jgi:hypothetical protein